ncbi:MAG: hypothetical protein R2697_17060 [Ilumatobacteraceae bacterium]
MTRVVVLERTTRRLHTTWRFGALAAAALAGGLAVAAGGPTVWFRIVLTVAALERLDAAIRHRTALTTATVLLAVAAVAVPADARFDRTIVAGLAAVAIVIATEAAHVARRLVTVAPVDDTRRDAAWILRLATLSSLGVAVLLMSAAVVPASWLAVVAGVLVATVAATTLTRLEVG